MKMKGKGKKKQGMRRFMALFLSLMLICAFSMTAFAAEGGDVAGTVNDGSGSNQTVDLSKHKFKAFQIFKGVYSEELGKLSNIDWGADANAEVKSVIAEKLKVDANADLAVFLTALEGIENESKVANDLAAAIASKLDMTNGGTEVDGSTENLEHGYYIVIDITDGKDIDAGESRNFALLQCTNGKIDIKVKTGTVTSDKQVKDVNDSNDGVNGPDGEWGTSADYDIDDSVPFVLKGTVAENFAQFQGDYKFVFHDTLSSGLTFNNDISVTINGAEVKDGFEVMSGNGEIQVVFANLKAIQGVTVTGGSVIEISYTATLNDSAKVGAEGNTNEMYLEYSNNPSGGDETGTTPVNKVIVFTYQVDINKVNGNGDPLEGAEFALYKADPSYEGNDNPYKDDANYSKYNKPAGIYTVEEGTEFSFKGIDDGEYLLVETKTPEGYNSIDPLPFTVTAGHTLNADGSVTLDLSDAVKQLGLTSDNDSGTMTTDVKNQSGSLLPSTGGIGTTMFYIIGGILMVGACMMLFVRKIMTNEKR